MSVREAGLLISTLTLAGCSLFPAARDVTVQGTIRDPGGLPISGVSIYYVVLKYRPLAMPGIGAHALS